MISDKKCIIIPSRRFLKTLLRFKIVKYDQFEDHENGAQKVFRDLLKYWRKHEL